MTFTITAHLQIPVTTEVEAETEEEAVEIARKRHLGKDIEIEWVLNEALYQEEREMN